MKNMRAPTARVHGSPSSPNTPGSDPAAPVAPVVTLPPTAAQAFTAHCAAVRGLMIRLIRRSGAPGDDVEQILAEIWVRAWKRYPAMFRAEQEVLARGAPSPHKWRAWFRCVAEHYLIDLY